MGDQHQRRGRLERRGSAVGGVAAEQLAQPRVAEMLAERLPQAWRRARCRACADRPDAGGERQRRWGWARMNGASSVGRSAARGCRTRGSRRPRLGRRRRRWRRRSGRCRRTDRGVRSRSRHGGPAGRPGAASGGRPARLRRRRTARRTPSAWSGPWGRRRSRSPIDWRILPPGAAAFSSTVTATPWRARSMAAARPPAPAPITVTCGVSHRLTVASKFDVDMMCQYDVTLMTDN